MKVYVVIVTYNGMKWIDWCLDSLRASTVPVVPILVDNGSTDETEAHVTTNYPEVVWLPQGRNLGFGGANNVGIRYAMEHDADAVLLLNQDAAISPDMVERMVKHDDGHTLLTPIHLNGKGTAIDFHFRRSLLQSESTLVDDWALGHVAESYPIGVFCAACWYVPVHMLRMVGGFNPLFFHYGEDDNLYNRFVYHGFTSRVVPGVYMYHDRLTHGNTQMYKRGQMLRELLVAATNQNLTTRQRLFRYYRVWGNQKSHVLDFVGALCRLALMHGKVQSSNAVERKKASAWI